MSRMDTAAEPTMEEILASIRKIIADEPGQARKSPDPLATNPLLKPAISAASIQLPPDGRAAFGNAATPAPAAAQALGDSIKPVPIAIEDDLADLLDGPPVAIIPPASVSATVADPWASLKSLRSTSPAPAAPERKVPEAATGAAPALTNGLAPAAAPKDLAVVPAAASTGPLSRKSGFWPPAGGGTSPVTQPAIAAQTPAAPVAPDATPSVPLTAAPAMSVPLPSSKPMNFTAPVIEEEPAPIAVTAPADYPAAAAAAALDALAAGLAAFGSDAEKPAAPASAVGVRAPVVTVAPAPAASVAPAVRSLEDLIGDMLRPMLQQWLTDNMPRIVEKALRVEAAKSVKTNGNGSNT